MRVSVIGSRYGRETATLLAAVCNGLTGRTIEIVFGRPQAQSAEIWVLTDWDESLSLTYKECIRPGDIVLLNSDDAQLLTYVAGLLCNTVTFGYHLKSTVTLSGRSEDVTTGRISYVLALQRPMLTCRGTLLEPCELRFALSGDISPQSAMAVGAFLLAAEVAFFP